MHYILQKKTCLYGRSTVHECCEIIKYTCQSISTCTDKIHVQNT